MTTIQQKLAAEQEQIATMDDATEAALAGACLRWKAAAIKGEKGAADELLKADAALRSYREAKNPAPEGGSPADSPGEWFRTEKEALHYLHSLGYDISAGKFNQDKNAGLLTVSGKKISKFSVLQYGQRLKQTRQTVAGAVSADLTARKEIADTEKAEHDARKAKQQADDLERQMSEKWILRDDADDRLAAVIGQLGNLLHRHTLQAVPQLIHLCGGDPARGAELYDGAEEIIIKSFNDLYHAGRIDGVFTTEDAE